MAMKIHLLPIILLLITKINCLSTVKDSDSQEDDFFAPGGLVLPKQIFNDGKPFYVEKDPVSGQLDFSSKKPAGIEPENNEIFNPKEKIVLSSSSPNIHDFLNLPVKYSSSKFVYPLVSSSYANLKYQGNNKNYISSLKNEPSTTTTTTTTSPNYHTLPKKGTTSIKKSTPKQPAITTFRPITKEIFAIKTTTESIRTSTTTRHIPSIFDRSTTKTNKYIPTKKYTTSTEQPEHTEKYTKYVKPTKQYTQSAIQSNETNLSKMPTQLTTPTKIIKTSSILPKKTTKIPFFPTRSSIRPNLFKFNATSEPKIYSTKIQNMNKNTTKISTTMPPVTGSLNITKITTHNTAIFPSSTEVPTLTTLDSADVYNRMGQRNETHISMADIFNSLAEEENNSAGLDKDGNLISPISPSKPSPFTLHQVTKAVFPTVSTKLKTKPSTTTKNVLNFNRPQNLPSSIGFPHTNSIGNSQPYIDQQFEGLQANNELQKKETPIEIKSPENIQGIEPSLMNQYVNEYVNYQVQQPNMMQYHQMPNMNNVVISPGQNSASFVLGSQQSIGSTYISSVEKQPLFQGNPIQFGTVINEEINPQTLGHAKPSPLNQEFLENNQDTLTNGDQITHELLVSSNIRFPSEPINTQYIAGSVSEDTAGETVNGHAQPLSMQQLQQQGIKNPLVFPKPEPELETLPPNNKVVFQPEVSSDGTPQKQEILTLNQQLQNKLNLPQLPEDLTPPYLDAQQSHNRDQNILARPQNHVSSLSRNEYNRKPLPSLHRSDRPLPNILPQFRPNAKAHPPYHKDQLRPQQSKYPSYRPMFSHRRQPIPGGNRYRIDPGMQEANRRVYRVPSGPNPYFINRSYFHRYPPHLNPPLRIADGYIIDKPASPTNLNSIQPVPQSQTQSIAQYPVYSKNSGGDRLPAFEEDDFPIKDNLDEIAEESELQPKLEPVVTLQMLQSQKKPISPSLVEDPVSEKTVDIEEDLSEKHGVYVVYPAKGTEFQFDDQFNEDSSNLNSNSADYQNTPFSVIRDQPQEPILMVKNKPQQNKDSFPYPMEKPDAVYGELTKKGQETEVMARIINRQDDGLKTEVPIAIAYTPTEPSKYYTNKKFSQPNLANSVIKEIRDTQTEISMDDLTDIRGQNFERDFMPPFYPSMSLATDSPDGWSAYQQKHDSLYEKRNINRVDGNNKSGQIPNDLIEDSTTKKSYDPDSFQVELQGGFKPIYPPDYHLREALDSNEMEMLNKSHHGFEDEEPIQRASMTSQASLISPTTSSLIQSTKSEKVSEETITSTTLGPKALDNNKTIANDTTEKPIQRKKPPSLVSLLFGDYDDDYEEKPSNS